MNGGRLSCSGFDAVQFQTCSSEVCRHIVIFNLWPAYIITVDNKVWATFTQQLKTTKNQAVSYFNSPWMNPIWAFMIGGLKKNGCQTISHRSELADNHFLWFAMWSFKSPITLLWCRRCILCFGREIIFSKHIRHGKTVPEKQILGCVHTCTVVWFPFWSGSKQKMIHLQVLVI